MKKGKGTRFWMNTDVSFKSPSVIFLHEIRTEWGGSLFARF